MYTIDNAFTIDEKKFAMKIIDFLVKNRDPRFDKKIIYTYQDNYTLIRSLAQATGRDPVEVRLMLSRLHRIGVIYQDPSIKFIEVRKILRPATTYSIWR